MSGRLGKALSPLRRVLAAGVLASGVVAPPAAAAPDRATCYEYQTAILGTPAAVSQCVPVGGGPQACLDWQTTILGTPAAVRQCIPLP